jgi:hypothetical protein
MTTPEDQKCVDLLEYEIAVFRCANTIIPFEKMVAIFASNKQLGTVTCLRSHVYWIYKLVDATHAYDFARALFEASVERNEKDMIIRTVEMYLKRKDADFRVMPYFEKRSDLMRTLEAQFLTRLAILEHHATHLQSLSGKCEKLIEFLASRRKNCVYVKISDMSKMRVSPTQSSEETVIRLSVSDKVISNRRRQIDDEQRRSVESD